MASNSKNLGELLNTTETVDPSFVSDQDNTSTGYFDLPNGTTAQRPGTETSGMLRFNSTFNLAEYYDGTTWKAIDSPPTVSSVSPDNFDTAGDTITVTGSGFGSGATVKLENASGTEFNASSVTFTNSNTLSFDITQAMVDDDDDPYIVKVTNPSGLTGSLSNALDFAPDPVFVTSAGTVNIYDSARGSYSFDASATSTETDATLSYAVTTGSLPTGASINSSTGAITGFSAVGSDTSTTFTVTATATDSNSNTSTNTRSWTLNVKAPIVTSYTSTGSGTFTVPSGITTVDVLVVAGGGSGSQGGGGEGAGGGGAGGLIYRPAFPVTPGGSISYSVGGGGGPVGNDEWPGANGQNGQDSSFGSLTAKGGGYGGGGNGPAPGLNPAPNTEAGGGDGGSGGGTRAGSFSRYGGLATQPQQPGDSSTYGFGNPGGNGRHSGSASPDGGIPATGQGPGAGGSGGGGAGAAGSPTPSGQSGHDGGPGGAGKAYSISGTSTYYAGGGGGSGHNGANGGGGGGGQGGGGAGAPSLTPGANGGDGVNNRGGGGGGTGNAVSQGRSGAGGSGIVIVSY